MGGLQKRKLGVLRKLREKLLPISSNIHGRELDDLILLNRYLWMLNDELLRRRRFQSLLFLEFLLDGVLLHVYVFAYHELPQHFEVVRPEKMVIVEQKSKVWVLFLFFNQELLNAHSF